MRTPTRTMATQRATWGRTSVGSMRKPRNTMNIGTARSTRLNTARSKVMK
jgi:hypothetical protein